MAQEVVRSHPRKLNSHRHSPTMLAAYLFLLAMLLGLGAGSVAEGQGGTGAVERLALTTASPQEAITGFDEESNGLASPADHEADKEDFEEVEELDEGLGPLFNARSCADCHMNPVVGAGSQVTELRAGTRDRFGRFQNLNIPVGDGTVVIRDRSLVNDRSVCPNLLFPDQEAYGRVPDTANVRSFRVSISTLGDGFVEAVPSSTLQRIAFEQCRRPDGVCGQALLVPVVEAPGVLRVGRFGWKSQHASLLSFSGDAYLNEMGITSRLNPADFISTCDMKADPEDEPDSTGVAGVDRFARFMRATKAPARDARLAATVEARIGADIFDRIGCDKCHVQDLVTAAEGSVINGGTFTVPAALGNKVFHPFGDFLLHNVGTGDGIVQNGGQGTANKIRTAALWGVRMRSRLMHDGESLTFADAIQRHGGEALGVRRNFNNLSDTEKGYLFTFLRSL